MGQAKQFDEEEALDRAIGVFREHGFEGTTARMLVDAMRIGRQSLYDTFGDKWQLYREAYARYGRCELTAHLEALRSGKRAIDGLAAFLNRVVDEAELGCLGLGSIVEFGRRRPELADAGAGLDQSLRKALAERVEAGQDEGDIAKDLDPDQLARFLINALFGLRIAARSGATREQLRSQASLTLRALR